jgi:hypothetical protein
MARKGKTGSKRKGMTPRRPQGVQGGRGDHQAHSDEILVTLLDPSISAFLLSSLSTASCLRSGFLSGQTLSSLCSSPPPEPIIYGQEA